MGNELTEFHHFLSEKLSNGIVELSPEEALDEWRRCHPQTDGAEDDAAAIQEGLDDMTNGDKGMPFSEFDLEFRRRHHLPTTP